MSGQQEIENLQGAGFSSDEIASWQANRRAQMTDAGFNDEEVNSYFGQAPVNDAPIKRHFDQAIGDATKANEGTDTAQPKPFTMEDAFTAGWQNSVSGLMKRGKAPDVQAPEDAAWYQRLAMSTTSLAGDIPAMVGGFLLGGAGGIETGPGALVTGTAGAFALPAGLRSVMMDAYQKGEFHSSQDFIARAGGVFLDTAKGWVTGAATAAGGIGAGGALTKVGAGATTKSIGVAASEVTAMVTASKAMEGQLPEPRDFLDAALTLAAFKAVPAVAGKIQDAVKTVAPDVSQVFRDVYAQTGKKPGEVMHDATIDPTVHQDLMAGVVPEAYKSQVDPYFTKAEPKPAAPVTPEPGTLEAAQANILDKISVGDETAKTPTFDRFYTTVIDDMNPMKLEIQAMTKGEKVPSSEDPYVLARLTRGSFGKADQFLTNSPYDFNTYKNTGKSLKTILEPFKSDLDGVRAYAVAKRTLELEGRGVKSGFNVEDAAKVVGEGGKYETAVKDLVEYQNNVTKYLKDSGILSKEAFSAMQSANKNYVPFYRLMDTEGVTGAGRGIGTKNPIKGIKGSDRAIVDPIESIIKNTYTYIALADRNEVAQKFVDLANKTEDPGQFISKTKPSIRAVTVNDAEMKSFLQEQGVDKVPDDLLTVFRAVRQPLANDEIAVFNKGKREVYQVNPEVAKVFKALDKESVNWIVKILSAPTKMFRAGVTLSPDFFPRNIVRDQFDALINSKSGFIPLLDTVRGAASMLKADDAYQNWLKSGGANATMVTLDRDYIQRNVIQLNKETGFADHAWNLVKAPVDALRIVSELAENATRLGEFKKAMGGDASKAAIQNAGFQSREVTLDFARIGSKTQAVNMLIPFFNAQLQGIDRIARAWKDDPMGVSTKVAASITVPSVLLWWNNHDDPRYADIPDWQKDMFWLVMTKDHIYRIPKPHEAGIIFGSGIERFLDWTVNKDPEAAGRYTKNVIQSFAPGYVPAFAQPIIEQFANKSLFTGGNIIPAETEKLLPEYQYTPYTTELSKALGRAIGSLPGMKQSELASPAIVDNYIRQWSGGLGMYTVQLADAGLRKAGVLPDPVKPASTLADIPIIKAFVVRYPSAGAQSIQDFYDGYDKRRQVLDTVKYLAKQGNFQAAVHESQLAPEAMIRMDGIRSALSQQQKFINLVYKNPNMPADDKRQLIDSSYYQMISIAKSGNALMRQIDATMAQ